MKFCNDCGALAQAYTTRFNREGKRIERVEWECPDCGAAGLDEDVIAHLTVDEKEEDVGRGVSERDEGHPYGEFGSFK